MAKHSVRKAAATPPNPRLFEIDVDLGNCAVKLKPREEFDGFDDGHMFLGEAQALVQSIASNSGSFDGNPRQLSKAMYGILRLLDLAKAAYLAADPHTEAAA